MSSLDSDSVAFHGPDAPVRTYVTNEGIITVAPTASVRDAATAIIDADDNIGDAAEEMMKDYVRHALVRDEHGFVGVLSMRDVLSAFTT